NLIHDVGYLGQGMITSWDMLVSSDETIGLIKHMLKSIEVDAHDLAVDVIDEVGPGGHFLGHNHTHKHFKEELWVPKLANRRNYENWKIGGSLTYSEKVKLEVQRIINEYQPGRLSGELLVTIAQILAEAEKDLVGSGA
ncbi:MAG TPA: trimethylamine methyltransferase, partial [Clostridia bacterium]|nr:trimethylamine methyltransferase [Clostridia bacterium]